MISITHPYRRNSRVWSIVLLSLLVSSLWSCAGKRNEINPVEIKGITTKFEEDFLWPTRPTYISDNRLLYIDEKETCFIHLYNLSQERKIYSGFHIGRGPSEMLGPFSISVEDDTTFWIHDIVKQEFKRFVISHDTILTSNKISFHQNRILYPNIITNDYVIALNLNSQSSAWVCVFDSVGSIIKELVKYPDNRLDIPQMVFMESYQGNLKVKPDNTKFVLACRYTDLLNIYNLDGTLISSFRTENPFSPKINAQAMGGGLVMAQDEETMLGFIDLAVSDEYVFGLFSGKSRKDKNPSYCNKILQFDWNGQLLNVFSFDESLISITCSKEEDCLYMFVMDENKKKLAKFRINSENNKACE